MRGALQLATDSFHRTDQGRTGSDAHLLSTSSSCFPRIGGIREYCVPFVRLCPTSLLRSVHGDGGNAVLLLPAAWVSCASTEAVLRSGCFQRVPVLRFTQLSLGHPLGANPAPCGLRPLHFPASSPKTSLGPPPQNAFLALGAGPARVASRKSVPSDIRAKQHWRKSPWHSTKTQSV
jgi:hypothetical protein